ncbi:monovalent cation:proton antiporter-2 (CPA2) family protein [Marinibaculum pumilum]|uniref:Monovalent cation:proton antiporter-2 (CPA2) family protein n=1 Tax=Marinibaculum pumilum TaxID=1766165 RepID=A0ABV7L680_9PROT
MSLLPTLVVFLAAAVFAVPLFKRIGLGSVLGYLAAGIVIGPMVLGLVQNVDEILHIAELGVVMLLFLIGLELQPTRLWTMRRVILGLGGGQVLLTGAALGLAAWLLGIQPLSAAIIGLSLALSSTAFALQIMAERSELTTRHGRAGFSILLFQDLAAVPLIVLVPIIAELDRMGLQTLTFDTDMLLGIGKAAAAVAVVVLGGRYAVRPLFRYVTSSKIAEAFTAVSLFIVVGTALMMEEVGLSMALGAFLAGVLLADSEFRHALEADIGPFKGLLLGLFFIGVGMSIRLDVVAEHPGTVALLVAGLLAIKAAVLFLIGRSAGMGTKPAIRLAATLCQGGEFAFVIFGVAGAASVIDRELADTLTLVVTISMVMTPLLLLLIDRTGRAKKTEAEAPTALYEENEVIIAGFGRVGQIVGRILRAKRIPFTALEASHEQVDFVRNFGGRVYYGDASRLDFLRAVHADTAHVFVIAIEDIERSIRCAELLLQHYPHLKIIARARNRGHAHRLMAVGVKHVVRETFASSLELTELVLEKLGMADYQAQQAIQTFRELDERRLREDLAIYTDQEAMAERARQWEEELEELFNEDARRDEVA